MSKYWRTNYDLSVPNFSIEYEPKEPEALPLHKCFCCNEYITSTDEYVQIMSYKGLHEKSKYTSFHVDCFKALAGKDFI